LHPLAPKATAHIGKSRLVIVLLLRVEDSDILGLDLAPLNEGGGELGSAAAGANNGQFGMESREGTGADFVNA